MAKPRPTDTPDADTDSGDALGAAEMTRRVAEIVHQLRKDRGLSLDDLSKRSGVSRAALSQIEQCKTNPTLSLLWKIAAGLQVPFASLLGQEPVERARVMRWRNLQVLTSADGGMESRPLMPAGAVPNVESYDLRLQPRALHRSDPHAKGTRENLTLLTGTLRVHVGDETYDLAAGDSIFFAADIPHAYENTGRNEARCVDMIIYGRPG